MTDTGDASLGLDWSGLEILGPDECFALLRGTSVGRIGFTEANSPVILPVNFTMDGSMAVFKTAEGSKLSAAMLQKPVCLEIDEWDSVGNTGWSVLAKGFADVVMDDDEIGHLDRLPVQPWARPDQRHFWVRVMIEELTGRRILSG